ncbi:SURF1 family protein [Oxalicibacterium faecigallinarum]|uniref:SURF1-like protein n=1 Tax=Oxalicibacterium faecigallinarum TaxID=573741 RepID=A0A8J3F463_9BURK|nr:SURF1 family protein [Oxalicibacterium faecigallinarum]GGI20740.1 SURF1-like protein [Oxalicibacterium faecigallinarum]
MSDRTALKSGSASEEAEPLLRSKSARLILVVLAVILFAGFFSLGTWQLYRLQWKLALIERVEQRAHAAPVAAPTPDRWSEVNAASDEYRHVTVRGHYQYQASALTQATTELGAGYWLLTPLRDEQGSTTLINRGFVSVQDAARIRAAMAGKAADALAPATEPVEVNGLLRITEPGGGFLRANDPAADRWHSRDVAAVAQARGLTRVAPYFIDADASRQVLTDPLLDGAVQPVGGLTVISFHNNHLVYALTWYALALMVVAVVVWIARTERKRRAAAAPAD